MDPRDRLAPAHYRFIKSMSADDPMPLTPEGASAVKVRGLGQALAAMPCHALPCPALPCPAPPCTLQLQLEPSEDVNRSCQIFCAQPIKTSVADRTELSGIH